MHQDVLQIVPALPPAVNGLGDYASLLARELHRSHGITSRFLMASPCQPGRAQVSDFGFHRLGRVGGEELEKSLESLCAKIVILHYVGYAYQKRGCPFWIVSGLRRWLRAAPRRRLITVFHELFAFGPPWTSSFWTSPIQRYLAARLATLSGDCVTNLHYSANWIQGVTRKAGKRISILPVFSNIGEPVGLLPFSERENTVVVFGGTSTRMRVHDRVTSKVTDRLQGYRFLEIGPKLSSPPTQHHFQNMGVLPPRQVSEVLSKAKLGLFNCDGPFIGKSGVFAAYAAHGVVPVCASTDPLRVADGLYPGKHYISYLDLEKATTRLDLISEATFGWYRDHSLKAQAKAYRDLISTEPPIGN